MKKGLFAIVLGTGLIIRAASAQSWETDPAFGARRNAYGPGLHMDATGRPYRDGTFGGPALEPIRRNVYGPGIDADATGRRVVPDYEIVGDTIVFHLMDGRVEVIQIAPEAE